MNEKTPYHGDALLLLKISHNDQAAFNMLFQRYRNQLFTYSFKITKSAEESEEIVLDVFLKIWHGREALTEIENFEAFLFRVAYNRAIDFLRKLKKDSVLQQQVWENMQEPLSGEYADTVLLLKATENILAEAVEQLSPQRQKVFYLHHHGGLTNQEIAERLNLSKNTVRNHLAASLEFIRKVITEKLYSVICLFL
ncbi:RNA polymerase sigma factor [Flavitalea antarctica]